MRLDVVILAAGKGTRMNSNLPKVMHKIAGKPMIEHVVDCASSLGTEHIHLVVGHGADVIKRHFLGDDSHEGYVSYEGLKGSELSFVNQDNQLGTGHAVQQAMPNIPARSVEDRVLVLYGDVPLVSKDTLQELIDTSATAPLGVLTLFTQNPEGLGRIIRDDSHQLRAIVEERDASEEQKGINEVNSGILITSAIELKDWLSRLSNDNAQGEYYLTDIIAMAVADGHVVESLTTGDEYEVQGVNDKLQLCMLERHFQMIQAQALLATGVTVMDPTRVDIRGDISYGRDLTIDVNVVLEGQIKLGNNVSIGANCLIKDATLGDDVTLLPGTIIDGAVIGNAAIIGPYARLRPGTVLADSVKIGNFVETKKAVMGNGSKANHLAYIGDAAIGADVNIGAGTIFCNYDGVNKHTTTLGDNVFVGSNSVLVAPVELENGVFVAAGSVINRAVPCDNLAVGRAKQRNVTGWKRPAKK
ncbi:MAG: bifunctional UDP-N-acetylglucosamine diphosphorylase/glucosamine-1-phosphate N-acetyltransferase GlmU [Proteobacteria bacterium]|nr:bifunctional UDP-N-acetylglucosamine diphosphorylase/glucosamine-1-phosphate N-acetyltransferase GlmU [Pseudomonadota bacterium]MDA0896701.1 bifunctional UDP-N-acetylglucosamine diphosphorylase/glucosamine-1-phosphate N-acetyltransferase GlmU [Pseudomonadota bacterium]MDA1244932.1 bifunctional UDP-N-acetylglucosamine diphosphorylase/glucosamine-1-phosphate N-acetyltransferase GlmU [Pseudomonadota bacterium]